MKASLVFYNCLCTAQNITIKLSDIEEKTNFKKSAICFWICLKDEQVGAIYPVSDSHPNCSSFPLIRKMKNIVIIDGHGNSGNQGSVNNVSAEVINSIVKKRKLRLYNLADPASSIEIQTSNQGIMRLLTGYKSDIEFHKEIEISAGISRLTTSVQNKNLYRIELNQKNEREWELFPRNWFVRHGHLRICSIQVANVHARSYYVRVRYTHDEPVSYEYILKKLQEVYDKEFGTDDLEIYWSACRPNT
ncbi:MAG: hypothetical protein F6K31_08450 [Symploca sp. SIO2G7]|nr:hypothetical protein [Symploca sp. SIO2G7]